MDLEGILAKNRTLKRLHAGKRCFILGSGPSLARQDLTLLEDEVTIVVNKFSRHPMIKQLMPDYWVLADPVFFEKPDQYLSGVLEKLIELGVHTKMFFPSGAIQPLFHVSFGPLIERFFFHYGRTDALERPIDLTRPIPPYGQNVAVVCLMLAFYLGCNPIYLLGCEHDFLDWDREALQKRDLAHYYKAPADAAAESEPMAFDLFQECMRKTLFQYEQLQAFASRNGFTVFNATEGGKLEVFPRAVYEDLFPREAPLANSSELPAATLATSAIELLNSKSDSTISALALLEQAAAQNINTSARVEGIDYLRAICFARLGQYATAISYARQEKATSTASGLRQHNDRLLDELLRLS